MWPQEENRPQIEQKDSVDGRKEPNTTSRKRYKLKSKVQVQGTSVPDCSIGHFLSCGRLNERRPRMTLLLKEKHKEARLEFAIMYIDKPQCFWEDVL